LGKDADDTVLPLSHKRSRPLFHGNPQSGRKSFIFPGRKRASCDRVTTWGREKTDTFTNGERRVQRVHCTKIRALPVDHAQSFVHRPRVSRKARLRAKLMGGTQDKGFTFADAELLLFTAGFVREGGEGSHRVYRRADGRKMVLACHGKDVKPAYIRELRQLLK